VPDRDRVRRPRQHHLNPTPPTDLLRPSSPQHGQIDNIKMAFGKGKPAAAAKGLTEKDIIFPKGPEDTISALRWSPVANHLAAASWDGKVYIYDATNPTATDTVKGVAAITVGAPVLDCDFSKVSPARL
jgi:WD40 repeat protein